MDVGHGLDKRTYWTDITAVLNPLELLSRARTPANRHETGQATALPELGRKITQCNEHDMGAFVVTSPPEIRAHRGRPRKWYCGPIKIQMSHVRSHTV